LATLYNETPCTWRRRTHADTYMYTYVIKFSLLGRTARVVQFVCIIPAITQTVATVYIFKLTATETD